MAKKSDKGTKQKSNWEIAQEKATQSQKKRKAAKAKQSNQQKKRGSMLEYFKGVKLEMKKVVWNYSYDPFFLNMEKYLRIILRAY